jgi:hypothetical protein
MTEVMPVSGRVCAGGHPHHDRNIGYVEVLDLDTAEPVPPGELGTVAISPYYRWAPSRAGRVTGCCRAG